MKFTIKSLLIATFTVAVLASVSAPAINDLWSIQHYQSQNESVRQSMEKLGVVQARPDNVSR